MRPYLVQKRVFFSTVFDKWRSIDLSQFRSDDLLQKYDVIRTHFTFKVKKYEKNQNLHSLWAHISFKKGFFAMRFSANDGQLICLNFDPTISYKKYGPIRTYFTFKVRKSQKIWKKSKSSPFVSPYLVQKRFFCNAVSGKWRTINLSQFRWYHLLQKIWTHQDLFYLLKSKHFNRLKWRLWV